LDSFTQEKINLEISKIDTLVDKSSLLLEKCKFSEPDFFDLNAIGSILHSFYNGLESIFKLIHKANGGKTLTNTMWHSGKVNISAVPKYPKFIHAAVFAAAAFSL
jgi:hypothetical protein